MSPFSPWPPRLTTRPASTPASRPARAQPTNMVNVMMLPPPGALCSDVVHAHQPLRPGGDGRRDGRKLVLRFLDELAVVAGDSPAPTGLSRSRDRAHLHRDHPIPLATPRTDGPRSNKASITRGRTRACVARR